MLKGLYDFIIGLPTNAALREHREIILTKLNTAQERINELEAENANCKAQLEQFRQQIEAHAIAEQFVECEGVLFKRIEGGTVDAYQNVPYCPTCRKAMSIAQGVVFCKPCQRFLSGFAPKIPRLIAELVKRGHG